MLLTSPYPLKCHVIVKPASMADLDSFFAKKDKKKKKGKEKKFPTTSGTSMAKTLEVGAVKSSY